jgi:trans-aconitate methyltransferase
LDAEGWISAVNTSKAEDVNTNEWQSSEHALAYLERADSVPHRTEGEAVLLDFVPISARRILDLGTGNGRLVQLLMMDRPEAEFVALDFSPAMLARARERFAAMPNVLVREYDLRCPTSASSTLWCRASRSIT